jgi:uncharacterized protein (TIGR03435 family)
MRGILSIRVAIRSEAYKVRPHQIAGPDWLSMERFDIQKKLPDGATEEKVPQMLRTMLANRFGMTTHTESRVVPAYALIVGKNGAKFGERKSVAKAIFSAMRKRVGRPPVPFVVCHAVRWIPRAPGLSMKICAAQILAILAAIAPVWWFRLG